MPRTAAPDARRDSQSGPAGLMLGDLTPSSRLSDSWGNLPVELDSAPLPVSPPATRGRALARAHASGGDGARLSRLGTLASGQLRAARHRTALHGLGPMWGGDGRHRVPRSEYTVRV